MKLWLAHIGSEDIYVVAPEGASLDAIETEARRLYSTQEGLRGKPRDGAAAYFGGITHVRNLVGVIE